jgi:methylated-DNA-[protein]-cysteine S-methyltransferase
MESYIIVDTPVGQIVLIEKNNFLVGVIYKKNWSLFKKKLLNPINLSNKLLLKTKKEILEYFCGKRKKFTIPIKLSGTDFQLKTWNALLKIPYGKTITYKEQASLIKNPKAVRAVGRTNGLNPISIIVPCHRVVGSNSKLTGYAGGLSNKAKLIQLES